MSNTQKFDKAYFDLFNSGLWYMEAIHFQICPLYSGEDDSSVFSSGKEHK